MTFYLWLKAFHIVAVICWFAGIFYLPRLFVYHAAANDDISKERFQVMESKLYRTIMNPSMLVTLVLGIWMLLDRWQAYSTHTWMWLKIALVFILIWYHHYCLTIMKSFAAGTSPHSDKFLRVFNEIPVLILVAIVILVVVKPFI
ncbi:MAG: protoporphyrinogen oxidase HemJ [Pseudomonadales bacterium]|nr:protoporphyrinogen oxidase HemJ [Pseudomonadales bacterium]